MATFPTGIYSYTNRSSTMTLGGGSHSSLHNADAAEIIAIETELGIDPAGSFTNVAGRLDFLDALYGVSGTSIGSITIVNSYITNITAVSINITNADMTSVTIGTLTLLNALANATVDTITITNAVPNLTVDTISITNAVPNLTVGTITITNSVTSPTISGVTLMLTGGGSFSSIQIGAQAVNAPYTWPTGLPGSSDMRMSCGTDGVMSWAAASVTGGSVTDYSRTYASTDLATVGSVSIGLVVTHALGLSYPMVQCYSGTAPFLPSDWAVSTSNIVIFNLYGNPTAGAIRIL